MKALHLLGRGFILAHDLPHVLAELPPKFQWTLHNCVGHPVSEVMFLLGFPERAYNWVHDITVPDHEPGEGRG